MRLINMGGPKRYLMGMRGLDRFSEGAARGEKANNVWFWAIIWCRTQV